MSKRSKEIQRLAIAEFDDPEALLHAARGVRDAGYKDFDCHSPFPIHGMDEAMGLKRSPLGWIVGGMAFIGGAGALLLQWWTSAVDYRLVIAGKPFFSYQAFVPITFGLAVLLGAFASFIGMLALSRLPKFVHKVFDSDRFQRFSNDGFSLSLQLKQDDADSDSVRDFLENVGGKNIEIFDY